MSSICGVLHRNGRPVEARAIAGMAEVLAHWGPDAVGTWHEGEIGLAHLALWTTPEAVGEKCPWVSRDRRIVLTADARLDNRDDLLSLLRWPEDGPGHLPGDVELIARAYAKWGERSVERLMGDFAFALWDAGEKKLFCARDPIGIRPFYYFVDERRFLFGTEIKAIFTQSGISREHDPLRLALFVLGGHHERDRTQFQAIRALEPATALVVDARGLRRTRYWQLDPERELRFSSDEDYVEGFEEVFQKAVDARLRASTPVGSMLSGGLDATTMLAFAQQSKQSAAGSLRAYTWALREGDEWYEPDERPYVDAYLREHPVDHEYVIPDTLGMLNDRPRVRHLQDGPAWDIFAFAGEPMFERAKASGRRVLLFGNGGDETASFFANDHLRGLLFNGQWLALGREVCAEAARGGIHPARGLWRSVLRPLTRSSSWRELFQFQSDHALYLRKVSHAITPLPAELVRATGLLEYFRAQQPRFRHAWRYPLRCTQINMVTGANTWANLATLKWNSSVLSHVECRYPFLDRRVVEYCVAMPPEQHRKLAWSRRLLRRAAASRVPAKIAWRLDKTLTIPDLDRGVVKMADSLRERFAIWRTNPNVGHYIDLDRMDELLQQWIVYSRDRRLTERLDGGAFCRAVILGTYFNID